MDDKDILGVLGQKLFSSELKTEIDTMLDFMNGYCVEQELLKELVQSTSNSSPQEKLKAIELLPGEGCITYVGAAEGPVIQRKEIQGRVHWFVNGEDRGYFYTRANTHKAKIIEILYNQQNLGWIPHKTFMNACGWSEQEYFRNEDSPGRMQRQLNLLRKFLGLKIPFDHEKGVRFSDK